MEKIIPKIQDSEFQNQLLDPMKKETLEHENKNPLSERISTNRGIQTFDQSTVKSDCGCMMAISQILFGQYHIWNIFTPRCQINEQTRLAVAMFRS